MSPTQPAMDRTNSQRREPALGSSGQPTISGDRAGGWRTVLPVEECRRDLHRKPFRITHPLADHPLFRLDALVAAAQEAARRKGDYYVDAGSVAVSDKWGQIPIPKLSAKELIERIESAEAWMIIKHVEENPQYKAVLDEFAEFVRGIAGPDGAKLLLNPEMLVLITSPNRLTPFHFDSEVNFLVQVRGSKDLRVCDPRDRSISTEPEIERYYAVSNIAGNYKDDAESKATHFAIAPGDAVHIPSHSAHWVRNGDNVSVSLSLNFELPGWVQGNVYCANHYLRKLGLSPRPPGQSVLADRAKSGVVRVFQGTKRVAKRLLRR